MTSPVAGSSDNAVCYNAKNSASIGVGFNFMASHNGTQDVAVTKIPNTGALSEERWTLMSVMVDMTDEDPANWKLAVCADVNGEGGLDEDDPHEDVSTRLTPTAKPGPPGIFVSGSVFSNQNPLYVDWVELYGDPTDVVCERLERLARQSPTAGRVLRLRGEATCV